MNFKILGKEKNTQISNFVEICPGETALLHADKHN